MHRALIIETTQEVLAKAGVSAVVSWIDGVVPQVLIESPQDVSSLIGAQGQALNALEHLVHLLVLRKIPDAKFDFVLDINNYRKAHIEQLVSLAKEKVRHVIESGKAESLVPMSAYERKIVHTELASYKEITTESIGAEPHRRVVIKPLIPKLG